MSLYWLNVEEPPLVPAFLLTQTAHQLLGCQIRKLGLICQINCAGDAASTRLLPNETRHPVHLGIHQIAADRRAAGRRRFLAINDGIDHVSQMGTIPRIADMAPIAAAWALPIAPCPPGMWRYGVRAATDNPSARSNAFAAMRSVSPVADGQWRLPANSSTGRRAVQTAPRQFPGRFSASERREGLLPEDPRLRLEVDAEVE